MNLTRYLIFITTLLPVRFCFSQTDSLIESLHKIPLKYIPVINNKVDKYSGRVSDKMEKTLENLSRWENKIRGLLQKTSPAAEERLFGPGKQTFGTILQRIREGKHVIDNYHAKYDEYRDKLTTSLKYLSARKDYLNQKIVAPLASTIIKVDVLTEKLDDTEALEQFIKERKKQLIDGAIQYIGTSKYLAKINKEAWYYAETIRNYKSIFNETKRAEETARAILNKIPAFQKFIRKNSLLAQLFPTPGNNDALQAGLQTGVEVRQILQQRLGGIVSNRSGTNQYLQQQLQQAQAALSTAKSKLNQLVGTTGGGDDKNMPDFRPNPEKTKPFLKRIELGAGVQTRQAGNYFPHTTNMAFTAGYKLNQASIIGIGVSCIMGWGESWQHIKVTGQGFGSRFFADWKIPARRERTGGCFWLSAGMEMNYLRTINNLDRFKNYHNWEAAALVGVIRKYKIGKKLKGNAQLLFDFLHNRHIPSTPAFSWRVGYNF